MHEFLNIVMAPTPDVSHVFWNGWTVRAEVVGTNGVRRMIKIKGDDYLRPGEWDESEFDLAYAAKVVGTIARRIGCAGTLFIRWHIKYVFLSGDFFRYDEVRPLTLADMVRP